jgi:hypothetical protein
MLKDNSAQHLTVTAGRRHGTKQVLHAQDVTADTYEQYAALAGRATHRKAMVTVVNDKLYVCLRHRLSSAFLRVDMHPRPASHSRPCNCIATRHALPALHPAGNSAGPCC